MPTVRQTLLRAGEHSSIDILLWNLKCRGVIISQQMIAQILLCDTYDQCYKKEGVHIIDPLWTSSPQLSLEGKKDVEEICKRLGNLEAQSQHHPKVFPSPVPWCLHLSKDKFGGI